MDPSGARTVRIATRCHFVACERRHRIVAVLVCDLYPPCFRDAGKRAGCPETRERRADGEMVPNLVICGALRRSLEAKFQDTVEAIVSQGIGMSSGAPAAVPARLAALIRLECKPSYGRVAGKKAWRNNFAALLPEATAVPLRREWTPPLPVPSAASTFTIRRARPRLAASNRIRSGFATWGTASINGWWTPGAKNYRSAPINGSAWLDDNLPHPCHPIRIVEK